MPTVKDRKSKNKKDDKMTPSDPMSKDEKAVLKWLRRNLPTKKTKFMHSHVVEYFIGSKAIDNLLSDESPFVKGNVKNPENQFYLETREQCVALMDELLKHKMFHRATKIEVRTEKAGKKSKKTVDESKKKKRKIRLDMHLDQIFLDSTDAYVWIYDPTPWYYWAGGSVIVLVTIAICLFPLWPPWLRMGAHYVSIGAAGFLLAIICLAILKYCIFAVLFALSAGKLHFWIFPNLTEDVGFLASFMPVYDYTYTGTKWKKAKDSDNEESDDEEDGDDGDAENSESDDSTSKKSSATGKDFEIVDATDTHS